MPIMSRKQKRNLIPKRKIKSIKKIKGGANSTQIQELKQELKEKGAKIRDEILFVQSIIFSELIRYTWLRCKVDTLQKDWRNPHQSGSEHTYTHLISEDEYDFDKAIEYLRIDKNNEFFNKYQKNNLQVLCSKLLELYKELSTLLPLECTALNTSCDRAPDCSPGSIP